MSNINAKNAGYFSELAYDPASTASADSTLLFPPTGQPLESQRNLHGLTADGPTALQGWREITELPPPDGRSIASLFSSTTGGKNHTLSDGTYIDQFRVFTNGIQVVFAFKGTAFTDLNLTQIYNDLRNDGGGDYNNLKAAFKIVFSALTAATSPYNSDTFFTTGHSLGGGLAQTFALDFGLNGFGQNSLPISQIAINDIPLYQSGHTASEQESSYTQHNQFVETNTEGDIATLHYAGGVYLDPNPTPLPQDHAAKAQQTSIVAAVCCCAKSIDPL